MHNIRWIEPCMQIFCISLKNQRSFNLKSYILNKWEIEPLLQTTERWNSMRTCRER